MRIAEHPFGTTSDGRPVISWVLGDDLGTTVRLIDYGATITSIRTPDRDGRSGEITLGHGTVAGYEADPAFMGRTIGRYANRIARGRFVLGGTTWNLDTNAGLNHIHGGAEGLHSVVWIGEGFESPGAVGVTFSTTSLHGAGGYPGEVDVQVTYTLSVDRELRIDERVTADRDTVLNLTNHAYFNLAGASTRAYGDDADRLILDHTIRIDADQFVPVTGNGIPLANPMDVWGDIDLRETVRIGDRIGSTTDQIARAEGFDHTFVLNHGGELRTVVAHVSEPTTGRWLSMQTDKPGVQFYTGNHLREDTAGFVQHSALCLEAQYFPDSPNRPDFPSVVFGPDRPWEHTTIYGFGAA